MGITSLEIAFRVENEYELTENLHMQISVAPRMVGVAKRNYPPPQKKNSLVHNSMYTIHVIWDTRGKNRICFGIIRIKTVVVIVHGSWLLSMYSSWCFS